MSDCDTCVVRNRAICAALLPDELAVLGKLGRKQQVSRGQKVAEMGSTDSDGVKLHFEIRRQGKPVDPMTYLPKR